MAYPEILRRRLENAINYVVENKDSFVKHPGVDFTRNRKLTMRDTIALLITMDGGALDKELLKFSRVSGVLATRQALIQQRQKLKPQAFETVFHRFNNQCHDKRRWRGYRLFALDGSCVNLPRNPDAPSFVKHDSAPLGFNQIHLNAWYDLRDRTFFDAVLDEQPRADEVGAALKMIERNTFYGKNLALCDRGYEAYSLLAAAIEKPNLDILIRVKQDRSCLKPLQNMPLEPFDIDLNFTITTSQCKEHKKLGYVFVQTQKVGRKYSPKTRHGRWSLPSPYNMTVRAVRFRLPTGAYETVLTTVLDRKALPTSEVPALYSRRWGIETSFLEIKYATTLLHLHGRSDDFAKQQIFAALCAYNFTSRLVNSAVVKQPRNGKYVYKVNFTRASYLAVEYLRNRREDGELLMEEINRYILPIRPGRSDRRKVRPKLNFVGFTYRIAC